ncbi:MULTISPECIES: hypothetical protein [unclassified Bacillus (in: firmicutes)]|uniref:hypothetical protein n=1 Tax=unclassified Bacillus (in: firmicutes) TaxID=185979 RepID=UPI0008E3720C|nr:MULTISPECIES: hypothetical protein [unclassified Bacillus (in: firmicutes)]SFA89157.1 hypothetical protein SAMN02799634_102373 [Bacillus sp. UNCCL13]SFQ84808.1 hypothetical protein SAMN04488577_2492 [Bacillus sp. cl95]
MESSEQQGQIFSFSTDIAEDRDEFMVEIFGSSNSLDKNTNLPVTITKNFDELLRFIDGLEEN